MKLSIITINYNNAEGLRKTLASVAAQTYTDIEHIIVDGGSTDGSVEVIRDYSQSPIANRHEIVWVSEKDKGIYNAMNKGLEIALGKLGVTDDHHSIPLTSHLSPLTSSDYIQILNSGDILAADDVTERMMAALAQQVRGEEHPMMQASSGTPLRLEVKGNENSIAENTALSPNSLITSSPIENGPAIFYGNMIKEYPDGRRTKDTCGGGDYTPESFLYFYKGTLNHDCAYIRRDLFEKYGLYNEQMKICSDWEWYVRAIVLGGEKTVYTNIDVTVFDMTGISESDGKNRALIQQERRAYLESILPTAVLRDYDKFCFPIEQYQRLRKYHLWGIVHFMERMLFKFEKWFGL